MEGVFLKIDLRSTSYEETSEPLPSGKQWKTYAKWYKAKKQFETVLSESKLLETAPPHYLKQLIEVINAEQSNEVTYDCNELQNRLYQLVICLQCPQLFVEKKIPAYKRGNPTDKIQGLAQKEHRTDRDRIAKEKKDELKKQLQGLFEYQSIRNKFAQNLQSGLHRYLLCQTYIKRGTTDLNRDYIAPSNPNKQGGGRNLSQEILEKLQKDIQKYYLYYYDRLVHSGYQVNTEPKVSDRLIEHCCEKSWLIPIAHVLLLRDAQYQMMGKEKYTAKSIMQSDSQKFCLDQEAEDGIKKKVEVNSVINYEIAKGIRATFLYYMNRYSNTTLAAGVLKELRNEPVYPSFPMPLLPLNWNTFDTLNDWRELPFAVPDYEPDLLALRIGKAQNFSTKQVNALRKCLSMLLWQDCNIKKLLENDPELQNTDIEDLTEILRSIKELLNPERYYGHRTGKDEIRESVKKAAEKLQQYRIVKAYSVNKNRIIMKVLPALIVAQDISDDVMYISHAVNPHTSYMKKLYPHFLRYYMKKLEKNLHYYQTKKVILSAMGYKITDLNKEDKTYLKITPACIKVRQEMPELLWQEAEVILQDLLCNDQSPEQRQKKIEEYLQQRCKKELAYWGSEIPQEKKHLVYYVIFSQLVNSSLHTLWNHSVCMMEKLYINYLQKRYQDEMEQWLKYKKGVPSQESGKQAEF